jgi:molybdopterin synthase catalytic subunit
MRVAVQPAPFDLGSEVATFTAGAAGAGAVVTFTGIVRPDDGLTGMEIEHYPGMTEKAVRGIVEEATHRWKLVDALVIHRYGPLSPGEAIMMVATAAPHRGDAFAAAEFLMDYLKSRAPFWKKESRDGGESWVAAKETDEDALKRW